MDTIGTTFLLTDSVLVDGIIFAFSAFFRATTPVRLQVWRPVNQTIPGTFYLKLVWELKVIPVVAMQRENVSFCSSYFYRYQSLFTLTAKYG